MASNNKKPITYSCGGHVRLFYVYEGRDLVRSLITHENGESLHGFPSKGHFIVKAKKVLVKTSNPARSYRDADTCTMLFGKKPTAPSLTWLGMDIVESECSMETSRKKKQIRAGATRPVIAEKIKTNDVFSKPFEYADYKMLSYKDQVLRHLGADRVQEFAQYEARCNTANVIEFQIPMVLYYGAKYHYIVNLKAYDPCEASDQPDRILIFYGQIYETTNKKLTANEDAYFAGFTPRTYRKEYTGEEAEYISDIDGYDDDDTSSDEQEDEK